ncbi:hypothetical protein P12x_004532 [Tundrisphaera lichenicola]|uniref:hypothetical protein n=1 Tax=Tundrisphaera lichenicola TaxID=2029860 RepID=UPI003EBB2106
MITKHSLATICGLSLIALLGCSDDGLDKRYPVSGMVTYQGKPLESGSVTFLPEEGGGRGATGEITNGAYSLTTQNPGDGAFPGKYAVTVTSQEVDFSAADADSKKKSEKAKVEVSAIPDQASVAKAYKTAKSNIPQKYAQISSSGLTFEVKPETNKYDIELKD